MVREFTRQFTLEGVELIEKEVQDAKTAGRIYLPKNWRGRRVAVVLLPTNGKA